MTVSRHRPLMRACAAAGVGMLAVCLLGERARAGEFIFNEETLLCLRKVGYGKAGSSRGVSMRQLLAVFAFLIVLPWSEGALAAGLTETVQIAVSVVPPDRLLVSTPSAASLCASSLGIVIRAAPIGISAVRAFRKFLGPSASSSPPATITCQGVIQNITQSGVPVCGVYSLTKCKCTAGTCGP